MEIMSFRKYKYLHHSSAANASFSKAVSLIYSMNVLLSLISLMIIFFFYLLSSALLFLNGPPWCSFQLSLIYIYRYISLEIYTSFLLSLFSFTLFYLLYLFQCSPFPLYRSIHISQNKKKRNTADMYFHH